jgi:hypothetical protein
LLAFVGSHAAAAHWRAAQLQADKEFTSYAFAHEFGSGVYDFNGHTLQVYGLPFAWTIRDLDDQGPGVRLRLPVTLGFLDFEAKDVLETGLPTSVDSLSFVPGVEIEFHVGDQWRALPYAQAGVSLSSRDDVEARLYGTGLRAERDFDMAPYAGLYASELIYSAVDYRSGDLPNDDFVRWRNAVEASRSTGRTLAGRDVDWGWFAIADWYVDPPTGPATGVRAPPVQLESGVVFGTRTTWYLLHMPLPRIGLSYRFAGDLSSIRLVIGAPF